MSHDYGTLSLHISTSVPISHLHEYYNTWLFPKYTPFRWECYPKWWLYDLSYLDVLEPVEWQATNFKNPVNASLTTSMQRACSKSLPQTCFLSIPISAATSQAAALAQLCRVVEISELRCQSQFSGEVLCSTCNSNTGLKHIRLLPFQATGLLFCFLPHRIKSLLLCSLMFRLQNRLLVSCYLDYNSHGYLFQRLSWFLAW